MIGVRHGKDSSAAFRHGLKFGHFPELFRRGSMWEPKVPVGVNTSDSDWTLRKISWPNFSVHFAEFISENSLWDVTEMENSLKEEDGRMINEACVFEEKGEAACESENQSPRHRHILTTWEKKKNVILHHYYILLGNVLRKGAFPHTSRPHFLHNSGAWMSSSCSLPGKGAAGHGELDFAYKLERNSSSDAHYIPMAVPKAPHTGCCVLQPACI